MTRQDKTEAALVWCDLIYLNHTDRMSLYLYDIEVFQRGSEKNVYIVVII